MMAAPQTHMTHRAVPIRNRGGLRDSGNRRSVKPEVNVSDRLINRGEHAGSCLPFVDAFRTLVLPAGILKLATKTKPRFPLKPLKVSAFVSPAAKFRGIHWGPRSGHVSNPG